MSSKEIWYGVLEAGEKTSPVVRDKSIDAGLNKIYLYNYVRNEFVEYAQAIVEPKLRELADGDISREELDNAFKSAYESFSSTHKVNAWAGTKSATPSVNDESNEDIDLPDDNDEFIDYE